MKAKHPLLFCILDGFGEAPAAPYNAVSQAAPRFYYGLREAWPHTLLEASSECVGLPSGQMGNSEVGHLTMGAGRIVWQELVRIDRAVRTGELQGAERFRAIHQNAERNDGRIHLIGLVSDGGVHSSLEHLRAIIRSFGDAGVGQRVVLHALLDGRDTAPRCAEHFVADMERELSRVGGKLATVGGRYYTMDRDKRWERVKKGWDSIVLGRPAEGGLDYPDGVSALAAAYERDEGDEFVTPSTVNGGAPIEDGDEVFVFNFRADRVRQITEAFLSKGFDGFDRERLPKVGYTTMTQYREDFDCAVLFEPTELSRILPEMVADAGMRQLRIAETEKYPHVTFFFGGGREEPYPGEHRILVPSPKVATYDMQPEMSAIEVTDRLLDAIDKDWFDLVVLNYANGDMVGHTGDLDATVHAVKTLDDCLSRLIPVWIEKGGVVALTADHGNCEQMRNEATGDPHTAHTLNPVPFLLIGEAAKGVKLCEEGGGLGDLAPTLLPYLGLEVPTQMDGKPLASKEPQD
ncbi:MAG: phosphoglycerate mutase (2,3-diphosphoglycerate-independent) [Planctomycetota bacterium]|nr:MAG: phosphoglycerate mutase (2,3-diphosphoglycerate-independent) [Planctomycetota bacterium]